MADKKLPINLSGNGMKTLKGILNSSPISGLQQTPEIFDGLKEINAEIKEWEKMKREGGELPSIEKDVLE